MYRKSLLLLLAMVVGFFTASAQYNVMINVDNAANVKVYSSSSILDLQDGMNRITTLTDADNPLTIEAAGGASIVSVTKNQTETLTPSGDGKYRTAISAMMLDIVTSGGSAPVEKEVDVTVYDFSYAGGFTAKCGDTELSIGMATKVKEGAEIIFTPKTGYAIEKIENSMMEPTGTKNEDGTYTVIASQETSWIYVTTQVTGLTFTIEPDYAPNVLAMLNAKPDESEGTYTYVPLNAMGATKVVTKKEMEPIVFQGADGAEVIGVTRNGEPVTYREPGLSWVTGYVSQFEEGDVFVVTTKGREIQFTFKAADGNASLDSYIFSLADGTKLGLAGMEQTVELPLGAKVYITGRPGTDYRYVMSTSTASDMREWVQAIENGTATIYGTRKTGVTVNVDDATRVSVKQSNGRGDALQLTNGENRFELSQIQNALSVTATEGNYIESVALNGNSIEPNIRGEYLVTAEEGSYIDIVSRRLPTDVNVTISLNEGAEYTWLIASIDDEPIALSQSLTVKSGTIVSLKPALGYRIDDVLTVTEGCNVVKDDRTGAWNLTVGDRSDNAGFSIIVSEIKASQGNALVIVKSGSNFVNFYEKNPEGKKVKDIDLEDVNEVAVGNSVYMYIYSFGIYLKSVKVNGVEAEGAYGRRDYDVTVTEDCTIEVTTFQRVNVTTYNTIDDVAHITSGDVFVLDSEGNPVHNLECEVGQTVTFQIVPTTGYKFVELEKFYPEPAEIVEGLTYTINENDATEGMVMFRGNFVKDEENPSLTVRTMNAFTVNEDGSAGASVGYVYIYLGDGEPTEQDVTNDEICRTEYTAAVGSKLRLICLADSEYQLKSYCLRSGFPNSTFPGVYYTVSTDDADSDGVVWITGIMEPKGSTSIETVGHDGGIRYDGATMTITTASDARIYGMSGLCVKSIQAGSTSLEELPAGIYIAVGANGESVKFVK